MKLLIVRHGEPDYEHDSLTEKGWREAELLADRLCRLNIRAFYVSPLGRAQATARPTLERLGRKAEVLDWLHEFRGKMLDPVTGEERIAWDLMPGDWKKCPELFDREKWRASALYQTGNSGEVYDKTASGVDALLARHGYVREDDIYRSDAPNTDTIVLFCHLALGMTILSHLQGISPVVLWHNFFMPTSSVTTLVTEERRPNEISFRCLQVGDTSHLYAGNEPVSHAGFFRETYALEDGKEAQ